MKVETAFGRSTGTDLPVLMRQVAQIPKEDDEMERNEQLEMMLVKFYNMQAGTKFKSVSKNNQDLANELLFSANGDVAKAKLHIKEYVVANDAKSKEFEGFKECFISYMPKTPHVENDSAADPVRASLGILEQALMEVIKKQSVPQIESEIKGECRQMLQDFIKQEYGTIERKIVTVVDGEKKDLPGFVHEKFDTVLKFVANDEPVFLTGPAGSGKNYICKQVAEALGLKFYFTNAVTQEYKLTGFTDANGNYQPTQFYEAFKNGGVFMLDEMDASIPEVLVILNAAIANRYFDFPAPIGYVEAHPDFRVIAAGNTTGNGADYEYVGRNQLDAASLDRFAVVRIDYSVEIENGMACDIELADFCREFRKASQKVGVQVIVSYRAIGRLAKMVKLLDLTEALKTCLVKGLEKDDLNIICNELSNSKYKEALMKVA